MASNQEIGARTLCSRLRTAGHRALFAGGCVRDQLLGINPKDYDIATDAHPHEISALFEKTFEVGAAFGVVIVVHENRHYEVATFRKDGPYLDGRRPSRVDFVDEIEDAKRRDFTINALFYDPETEQVLDYVGGMEDLNEGVIRCVGVPTLRFNEDYLRLLRAVRFSARFDFRIDTETGAAIQTLAGHILDTSPERIREELVKMFCGGFADRGLTLLDQFGLLELILPEVHQMKGVEQPPEFHPEGDVFVHTSLLLKHLPADCSPTLAFGALLHDVGKPPTQTFEDRIRFNQHDKVGAEMAEKICRRLRFSNAETDRIVYHVRHHMRLATLPKMKESKRRRFIREEGFRELLDVGRLDCLGSLGSLDTIEWIEGYLENLTEEEIHPPPLLTGHDLIQMGHKPGPRFKSVLGQLEDAQLEGQVTSKEEALALAARLLA